MSALVSARQRLRRLGAQAQTVMQRGLAGIGMIQAESRIAADAQDYWADPSGGRWKSDSHWRDASVFEGSDLWTEIGRRHLVMAERGARLLERDQPWKRVVEWGCGGGANAVHFALRCEEFIGVDISAESLTECGAQVAASCETPFRQILVEVARPEDAVSELGAGICDLFLCFYVFELIPTPEYGARLLRVAAELLAPGGTALIQIKYDEGRFRTRPRRRAYRSGVAEMTTYPIAGFWELAVQCGLRPESVELVPRNELDQRYAYFLLSKEPVVASR